MKTLRREGSLHLLATIFGFLTLLGSGCQSGRLLPVGSSDTVETEGEDDSDLALSTPEEGEVRLAESLRSEILDQSGLSFESFWTGFVFAAAAAHLPETLESRAARLDSELEVKCEINHPCRVTPRVTPR